MIPKILSQLFRQRKGNKVYAVINLLGLSIAITVAILIYGFVVKEIQTDSFHKNGKNIYRVLTKEDKTSHYSGSDVGPFAPAIQSQVSGIEAFVRLWPSDLYLDTKSTEKGETLRQCIFADTSFFSIFTFPITQGIINTESPHQWVVISEKAAKQFFGNSNPIGKNLYVSDKHRRETSIPYQVIAVMKNIPAWSTIQTDIILDYRAVEKLTDWGINYQTISYLQLNPNSSIEEIEKQIRKVYTKNSNHLEKEVKLQALRDIYYDQDQVEYLGIRPISKGSLVFTWLLGGITVLILLLSSGNYMMIKIAQGRYQIKIFSIQRCFGANSLIVWKHFFVETTLYFISAGIIAILLAWGLFPFFLSIISPQFHYPYPISTESIIGFLLLLGIFIIFISSVLSYYSLKRIYINGIKNNIEKKNSGFDIQKTLAIVSIAIFCLLSVDTFIVYKQSHFLIHKDPGFNNQNTIELSMNDKNVRNRLLSNPNILSIACGSTPLPITGTAFFNLSCTFEETGEMKEKIEILTGDSYYLDTYQIKLLEGENFKPDAEPTREGGFPILVNQEFVRQARLKHPVGTIFQGRLEINEPPMSLKIIGVVKDFHFRLLYDHLKPVTIFYCRGYGNGEDYIITSQTVMRFQPGKRAEVEQFLSENEFYFSVPQYAEFYKKEKAFARLINIASLLAIFVGGLGIFAFSVFFANSRKKEVALRKINGGSEWEIQKLFNWEFIRLTLYACIISIPLAFYFIHFWLEKFAYRVTIEWYFFLLAVLVCLAFVILVITWQIRKIANINPVKCLREL